MKNPITALRDRFDALFPPPPPDPGPRLEAMAKDWVRMKLGMNYRTAEDAERERARIAQHEF